MNKDLLLTAVLLRIINDKDTGEEDLGELLGIIRAVKGPKRSDSMDNPCITINASSMQRDAAYKTINGTLLINVFADNYNSGNANVELLASVVARIEYLFDDKPLIIAGYNNYNLFVEETIGPLFDPDYQNEHYMSTRIKFNLVPGK